MTRTGWLIGGLTAAVVVLVAALMFMVGRATAPATQSPATNQAAKPMIAEPAPVEIPEPTPPSVAAPKAEPRVVAATSPTSIPKAFIGEWNEKVEDCGTGMNDTALRVEPKRVQFYESDAAVKRVQIHNERAITVQGSFAGEGEVWTNTFKMVLSRSGNDLTMESLTRHRCPG